MNIVHIIKVLNHFLLSEPSAGASATCSESESDNSRANDTASAIKTQELARLKTIELADQSMLDWLSNNATSLRPEE